MAKIYEFEGIKEISILDYFPSKLHKRMNLTPEQQIVSQFIIDFKNGYKIDYQNLFHPRDFVLNDKYLKLDEKYSQFSFMQYVAIYLKKM